MNPERWQRVKELLEEVVDLGAAERAALLLRTCGDDPELRREVESLLASHARAGTGFLNEPAADLKALATPGPTRTGRRIGVYQIAERIGQGGMGEVYRAVRVDGQYTKEVALKVVRGGFDSAAVQERFRGERQILASLDHPNIARLLDGGATEEGAPYLVMELIEGVPIDTYCEDLELSITERLRLFRQVCGAVQYAHQHLVIHRDIKPANILVTREGVPKLLDFGIAKLLVPSAGGEATVTQALTPDYASPEQVLGGAITTATDVFSLGIVLYRLLTGHSPYGDEPRTPLDLARAITEHEPGRPSSVVPRSPALRRRLLGDLDNIVLKAIRKEPARRYPSAELLSEDIRRHLEGLPIAARQGSRAYRARKFVRRHRVGIAAAALVALALIAGAGATLRQAGIARQQARRAEQRFNDVRQLANSLIFEVHDAIQGLPGATPARKLLLDRAVLYLDRLAQDSGDDVNLERELAWGYQRLGTVLGDTTQSNLGQVGAAEANHRKALALFEAVAKANPHDVTDQLNLAMAYRTRALFDAYEPGGRKEIDQALEVTDPLMRTDGGRLDVRNERAEEYLILALVQDGAGDRLQAVDSYRRLLDLRREILRTNPDFPGIRHGVAKATVLLAHQLGRYGSPAEALPLMNAGIADYESQVKSSGGDPGITREWITAIGRRADVEMMQGDLLAALGDFRRQSELIAHRAKLDPENRMLQSDLWVAEFEEGRAMVVNGRSAAALPLLEHAYKGYEDLHLEGDVGPGPEAMQAWIGEAQAENRDLAEGLKNLQEAATALAANISNYDDARVDFAVVTTRIGGLLLKTGRLSEASAAFNKALETVDISGSLARSDPPALYAAADAYSGLGDVETAEAAVAEACTSYEKSHEIWQEISHPSRVSPNGYLAGDPLDVERRLAACRRPSGV